MLKKNEKINTLNESQLVIIPASNFRGEVLDSKQPVLVEFWTSWSRACETFDFPLREVAVALAGKVKVVKVNADDSLDLSLWYEVECIPTLIFFVEGKPVVRIVGTATKDAILAKLKAFAIVDATVSSTEGVSGVSRNPGKEN